MMKKSDDTYELEITRINLHVKVMVIPSIIGGVDQCVLIPVPIKRSQETPSLRRTYLVYVVDSRLVTNIDSTTLYLWTEKKFSTV